MGPSRLRTRLVFMALVAMLPAFAIVVQNQSVVRREARERVLRDNLQLTRLAADQVASVFIAAERLLQTFSLLPESMGSGADDCAKVLSSALRGQSYFSGLAFVSTEGVTLCSSVPAAASRPVSDRAWFRRVMRARTTIVGEYQISQLSARPVIVIAHPIVDAEGRVDRVLALGLELSQLVQFVSTVKLTQGSTISVFDRNRTIVARYPDAEPWVGRTVPDTQAVHRLLTGADVDISESVGVDGVRRLYSTVPVNVGFDTGLYVGVGVESSVAFAGVNELLRQQLALLGFLSIAVIGAALAAGQLFVLRPLNALKAVAHLVARGDFGARVQLAGGVAELRELGEAVDSMAASLEVRQQEAERAGAVLRDSEARKTAILDSALDCIVTIDAGGRVLDFNPAAERTFGHRRDDAIGREIAELIVPPDLREAHRAGMARYLTTGQHAVLNRRLELRAMRADGSEFPVEMTVVPVFVAGAMTLFTANLRDITAQQEAATAAAERVRMTTLVADIGVALNRHESLRPSLQACAEAVVRQTNGAFARIWTINPAANVLELQASAGLYQHIDGAHARILVGEAKIGRIARDRRPTLTNQVVGDAEVHDQEWARREGMVAFAGYPLMIEDEVVGVIALFARHPYAAPVLTALGSIADHIALGIRRYQAEEQQRVQAEQLARTEAEFRQLFAANPLPMWVYDTSTWQFLEVNDAAIKHYGYTHDEFLSMRVTDIRSSEESDRLLAMASEIPRALASSGAWQHRLKSGELIDVEITSHGIMFRDKAARLVLASDVTARWRAERALRESEARFRRIAETIAEVFWVADVALQTMIYVSPAYERIWGRTCDSLIHDPRSFLDAIHPDDLARVLVDLDAQPAGVPFDHEYRICRPDGEVRWIWDRGFPVRDADGTVIQYVGAAQDITERRTLEAQFRQAQKMEAIGQLAGGVAHDFNNILTAILGTAEVLSSGLAADDPRRQDVEDISAAGQRAARLTRQLLAFSRKQILAPRVLRLATVIGNLTPMLSRLLGETIDLKTVAGDRAAVLADAGQIEQVVMNLAINARDAMVHGGRLTIETADITLDNSYTRYHRPMPPGPYVLIAVSDSGHGMDAATQQRIFEPFFTTKGPGRGTGLGLATVYGIVKQSGGYIWVYSEVGHGTTFKVYLPTTQAIEEADEPPPIDRRTLGGDETILVVEDEDIVRDLVSRTLRLHGYTVRVAETPRQAIDLAAACSDPIHLVLTDVILPDMNGRVMAAAITERHPEASVLCMSGYTDQAIVHRGVLDRGTAFLQKPFSGETLLRKVRDLLDRQSTKTLA